MSRSKRLHGLFRWDQRKRSQSKVLCRFTSSGNCYSIDRAGIVTGCRGCHAVCIGCDVRELINPDPLVVVLAPPTIVMVAPLIGEDVAASLTVPCKVPVVGAEGVRAKFWVVVFPAVTATPCLCWQCSQLRSCTLYVFGVTLGNW